MANVNRLIKSLFHLIFPVVILLLLAGVIGAIFFVYKTSIPPRADYLVTPQKFAQLSTRGAKITDEKWTNEDGTSSRGWLLRGNTGSPAVILLHKYGADRSYEINLGVKLNETTNYTVLMPDLRGHGKNPPEQHTSFSGKEIGDIKSALKFLRSAQTHGGQKLVGKNIGLYGIELGALVAVGVAKDDPSITTLVIDSVPQSSDQVLKNAVEERFPFGSSITSEQAVLGTYLYYLGGGYNRESACSEAANIDNRKVLLLAGPSAEAFQPSTSNLVSCFPRSSKVTSNTDISPTGFDLSGASLQQTDSYDNRVIYFLKENLDTEM